MIHIIGGGTFSHVRNHLALAAPAFGGSARKMSGNIIDRWIDDEHEHNVILHLTKMANHKSVLVTNEDVAELIDKLVADAKTRCIVMNAALCDYDGQIGEVESGKDTERLKTKDGDQVMHLTPADKIISRIRETRKDIFLVAFKTTTGATPDEQYAAGLNLLKANSANLVLANDTVTRLNMVITPEEARYHETTDRDVALKGLMEIMLSRMENTFTRSTVVEGPPVPWDSEQVPANLREVVNHCIAEGAYKPFRGATVGHFAAKVDDGRIITSRRKRDFNRLPEEGLILVEYDGDDKVLAHGGKPSVGGQSQRVIFREHPEADAIVHFHCPPSGKGDAAINVVEQWPNECGSHQCGEATSRGLRAVGGIDYEGDYHPDIKVVMLDNHGPNIVFTRTTPAADVIRFIDENFDLKSKTGGLVS